MSKLSNKPFNSVLKDITNMHVNASKPVQFTC